MTSGSVSAARVVAIANMKIRLSTIWRTIFPLPLCTISGA
jgi:hypothetical protein